MMIKVYVPKTYLGEIASIKAAGPLQRPSEFWLTKPDTWYAADLVELSISLETWNHWNQRIKANSEILNTDGKQLLKG